MWMPRSLYSFVLFFCFIKYAFSSCEVLKIISEHFAFLNDDYFLSKYLHAPDVEILSSNGRPIYESMNEPKRYLYHIQAGNDMGGRWIIGREVGQDFGWAFIESWATTPYLISTVSERSTWQVYRQGKYADEVGYWTDDFNFSLACQDTFQDSQVYISSTLSPALTGFYTEIGMRMNERPVYVHSGGNLYLYAGIMQSEGTASSSSGEDYMWIWIIGGKPGMESGLAYIHANVTHPAFINHDKDALLDAESNPYDSRLPTPWFVAWEEKWVEDEGFMLLGSYGHGGGTSTWQLLHDLRGRKDEQAASSSSSALSLNGSTAMFQLKNGAMLPLMGFGCGATARVEAKEGIVRALRVGYRLLDTAYDNEDLIAEVFREKLVPNVDREDVYITSKLWYTELGFEESLRAVQRSLHRLQTDYIDAYLIHWPQCYQNIGWMDCSSSVGADEEGKSWRGSWRALEKLYAEGLVLSIGVSNFDHHLLQELLKIAATLPQLVQNYHDVIHQDEFVRKLTNQHGIFYQAYSSLRSLLSPEAGPAYSRPRSVLNDIAATHHASSGVQVALRWSTQNKIGVLPRSSREDHLSENLRIFDFDLTESEMQQLNSIGLGINNTESSIDDFYEIDEL